MITRTGGTRRRVTLIGSAAALAVAAIAITAAATSSGGSGKPATPSHRYADYLDDQGGNQCTQPVSQRSGGWVCP